VSFPGLGLSQYTPKAKAIPGGLYGFWPSWISLKSSDLWESPARISHLAILARRAGRVFHHPTGP
jgi:hypothetical protein